MIFQSNFCQKCGRFYQIWLFWQKSCILHVNTELTMYVTLKCNFLTVEDLRRALCAVCRILLVMYLLPTIWLTFQKQSKFNRSNWHIIKSSLLWEVILPEMIKNQHKVKHKFRQIQNAFNNFGAGWIIQSKHNMLFLNTSCLGAFSSTVHFKF